MTQNQLCRKRMYFFPDATYPFEIVVCKSFNSTLINIARFYSISNKAIHSKNIVYSQKITCYIFVQLSPTTIKPFSPKQVIVANFCCLHSLSIYYITLDELESFFLKTSWQAYVDTNLVGTNQVKAAAICGHDGSIWAKSAAWNLTPTEAQAICKNFANSQELAASGTNCNLQQAYNLQEIEIR